MIRFTYQLPNGFDPRQLHRDFAKMGVCESGYEYLPGEQVWHLTVTHGDQAFRAETVLKIHGIRFEVCIVGGG